jgi:hypothetical protein
MIINAGIEEVVVQAGVESVRRVRVEEWMRTHLGELQEIDGRLVPVRPQGY